MLGGFQKGSSFSWLFLSKVMSKFPFKAMFCSQYLSDKNSSSLCSIFIKIFNLFSE